MNTGLPAPVPGGLVSPLRLSPDVLAMIQAQQGGSTPAPPAPIPPSPAGMPAESIPAPMSPVAPPLVTSSSSFEPLPPIAMPGLAPATPAVTPIVSPTLGSASKLAQQGIGEQQQAIARQAELERAGAEARLPLVQEQAKAAEAERLANEALNQEAATTTKTQLDAFQKGLDEYESTKIDPTRTLQGSRGVLAAVAVGLGALGSSLTGGPNYALDIINKAIDRDIRAQEAEIEKKRGKLTGISQLYNMSLAALGDKRQAQAAVFAARQNEIARALDLQAATMAPSAQQNKALELSGALKRESANTLASIAQAQHTMNYQNALVKNAQMENIIKGAQLRTELGKKMVPGVGEAVDEKSAQEARVIKADADTINSTIDNMEAMLNKAGTSVDTFARGQGLIDRTLLIGKVSKMAGTASLQDAEFERYASMISNPATWQATDELKGVLAGLRRFANKATDNAFKSYGLPGYAPQSAMDVSSPGRAKEAK